MMGGSHKAESSHAEGPPTPMQRPAILPCCTFSSHLGYGQSNLKSSHAVPNDCRASSSRYLVMVMSQELRGGTKAQKQRTTDNAHIHNAPIRR